MSAAILLHVLWSCYRLSSAPLWYRHSLMVPSSAADASKVGSVGCHRAQLISVVWASLCRTARWKEGFCWGSTSAEAVASSSKMQMLLSPDPAKLNARYEGSVTGTLEQAGPSRAAKRVPDLECNASGMAPFKASQCNKLHCVS